MSILDTKLCHFFCCWTSVLIFLLSPFKYNIDTREEPVGYLPLLGGKRFVTVVVYAGGSSGRLRGRR